MADDETKPRRKAKDNPWYRLATLHGEPSDIHDEIADKNRVIWNRWMASQITEGLDGLKTMLLEARRCSAEELTPFPDDELRSIEAKVGSSISADLIDFSDTDFEAAVFTGFVFTTTTFAGATFSGEAVFDGATFSGDASFQSATFFSGNTVFDSATFSDEANFRSATFSGGAVFNSATFSGGAFSGGAFFDGATFSGYALFQAATFGGVALFVGAEMKRQTFFDEVEFSRPPQFFGAKLHEGTTWHAVRWPKPPNDATAARDYGDAYERLKLEMDRLKKHGDELDFFARELQCRRVLLGPWKGLPFAIYSFLSDYGRSYGRPLLLLVATVLFGAIPIAAQRSGLWNQILSQERVIEAIGLSFANTLSVFGKPLIEQDALLRLPNWLKAVATIQTILGIVLLFLFGLGIRNRFRMK